jgi:exodeoxyribonuclease V
MGDVLAFPQPHDEPVIVATQEQQGVIDGVLARLDDGEEVIVITGPAGAGKTQLMKLLATAIQAWRKAQGMPFKPVLGLTPTGRAVVRLREVTGWPEVHTIHRAMYGPPLNDGADGAELKFGKPRPYAEDENEHVLFGAVLVDEGSMIGRTIWRDMLDVKTEGVPLIVFGDAEQLEPVNDTWGPNLRAPDFRLTEIHRQAADNPIIGLATAIRTGTAAPELDPGDDRVRVVRCRGYTEAAHWLAERRKADIDATLLTWSNPARHDLNAMVRDVLGLSGDEDIVVNDMLLIRKNNYRLGLMNGEVHRVTFATPDPDIGLTKRTVRVRLADKEGSFFVAPELMQANTGTFLGFCKRGYDGTPFIKRADHEVEGVLDRKSFAAALATRKRIRYGLQHLIHAHFGQALTTHSAQGSQWAEVGVIIDGATRTMARRYPTDWKRLVYVMVTRARVRLTLFKCY